MNICPNCSHSLLSHLRSHSRYLYCSHCRSETSDIFISAKNKATLQKSWLSSREEPARRKPNCTSLVSANFSV